ncbi:MAG: ribonuclease P [Euryarchaeota archaeon]|nr:ribonuclease P [Euryarchaeota archaeon]
MRARAPKPKWMKQIALERIIRLFQLAEQEFKFHPERSHRYVELARKISMKYNVRIPKDYKRRFCGHCYNFLKPGVNCKVRLRKIPTAYVAIICLDCGNIMRIPYKGKRNRTVPIQV